ncbi:MAG: hypothetical protein SXA11_07345 [Cyanobacteriota bacterium]|nr:hypothetical protein [Cyanobacteriota bacterium]
MIGLRQLIIAGAVMMLIPSVTNIATAQLMPRIETQEATAEGSKLMEKIKAELEKPLSLQQLQQTMGVILENKEEMIGAQETFIEELSSVTGVATSEIIEMMSEIGQANNAAKEDLVRQVETKLGTSLTPEQLEKIQQADSQMKDTFLGIQEQLASKLSEITGLSVEAIAAMLPQM